MKTQVFTVEGDGPFPVDMLNHDRCYPQTQNDARNIVYSLQNLSDTYRICLERNVNSNKDLPSVSRWESFGFKILESYTI